MPTALALPILFRALAAFAFIGVATYAGIANRSFLIVPVLAGAAVLAQFIVRQIEPSPLTRLKAAVSPDAPPANPAKSVLPAFGLATLGYGFVYGFSALIAALFQETEFERQLEAYDFWLIGGASIVAVIFSILSAKTGSSQIEGMMGDMQQAFADLKAKQAAEAMGEDEDFIIDGEFSSSNDNDERKER